MFGKLLAFVLLSGAVHSAPATNSVSAPASSTVVSSAAPPIVTSATGVSTVSSAASSAAASSSPVGTGSTTASAPPEQDTVAPVTDDPNPILWTADSPETHFDPVRGSLGAPILGPQNVDVERQNADLFIPPSTDSGSVKNAKWPFALSHNRVQTGGWARQQNKDVMPVATAMAGVNMRLEAGAVRELHWHSTAEWSYVISGSAQITIMNSDGQNYLANVNQGDLWYFPPGLPHSAQGLSPEGTEFLLVFPDGAFSEDETFLVTDWLGHVPKEVLAANFQVNASAFDHIPSHGLYIFPSATPPTDAKPVDDPNGAPPEPFTFALSQVNGTKTSGGSVKVVDSTTFKVAKEIAMAEVTVEPGAIRELHWHPTQDEWSYFLEGNARVTLFAGNDNSRTFDYQAGDVGYIPASFGHYVQNIGNTTLKYLEIFNSDRFQDISLNQWLALTPPALVKAHLDLDDDAIAHLQKVKPIVMGPGGA
jgi:oxalate decarboxylase family bicupin protein